jgi:hypothetical protein
MLRYRFQRQAIGRTNQFCCSALAKDFQTRFTTGNKPTFHYVQQRLSRHGRINEFIASELEHVALCCCIMGKWPVLR